MKRLEVQVSDEAYEFLQREVDRSGSTADELVQRAVDGLRSAVNAPYRKPTITPVHMGPFLLPLEDWRLAANERPVE